MDRFFLHALVREVSPRIVGGRVRGLTRWGPGCLALEMATRPRSGLVISLLPEASVLYLGDVRPSSGAEKPPERFKKLLIGAELVGIEPTALDRVVRFDWRRARPSGLEYRLELIVEWAGTRTGAYLIDSHHREVLDVFVSGRPRMSVGALFEPLKPPPGVGPVAAGPTEFVRRLEEARHRGLDDRVAVRVASGLSPLLVEELLGRHSGEGLSLEEAFETVRVQLEKETAPVLLLPKSGLGRAGARCLLSPIVLRRRTDWTVTRRASFNEAASDFFRHATELRRERRLYQETRTALRNRLKKQAQRLKHLRRDQESLTDPARMRRWGELLLAGHHDAKRMEREVELPDIYDLAGGKVKVPIEPRLDLVGNAQRYFRRARKTERSLKRIEGQLGRLETEIEYIELLAMELEDATEREDLEAIVAEISDSGIPPPARKGRKPKASSSRKPALRRFRGANGCLILVGRTGRSNAELTFGVARPGDLWFHAAEVAGAHVVLKVHPKETLAHGQIEEAAALAAYFSKARGSTGVEVIYTPRKNVRKIPTAPPGTVRVSQFKTVRVKPALIAEADEDD